MSPQLVPLLTHVSHSNKSRSVYVPKVVKEWNRKHTHTHPNNFWKAQARKQKNKMIEHFVNSEIPFTRH